MCVLEDPFTSTQSQALYCMQRICEGWGCEDLDSDLDLAYDGWHSFLKQGSFVLPMPPVGDSKLGIENLLRLKIWNKQITLSS